MEALKDILSVDKEILGGQPVFSGTRVTIETLFYHIEKGITIDEFLEDFPGVTKKHVLALLEVQIN